MSHTFASWTWPLGLKGHHAIVILEFTSMAFLMSNKQDREGQIPALEETGYWD